MIIIEGDLLFLSNGKDSFISKNELLTLISNILSQADSLQSNTGPTVGFAAAFETRMSNPPYTETVCKEINNCVTILYSKCKMHQIRFKKLPLLKVFLYPQLLQHGKEFL